MSRWWGWISYTCGMMQFYFSVKEGHSMWKRLNLTEDSMQQREAATQQHGLFCLPEK